MFLKCIHETNKKNIYKCHISIMLSMVVMVFHHLRFARCYHLIMPSSCALFFPNGLMALDRRIQLFLSIHPIPNVEMMVADRNTNHFLVPALWESG